MLLTSGTDGDLDVLSQSGEEVHKAFDGERARAIAHQCRDVRLFDAENLAGFGLGNAPPFDETVDLQREFGFQQFLLRMRQAEIGKNVAAAFLHADPLCSCLFQTVGPLRSFGHVNSAFPGVVVQPCLAAGG